MLKTWAEQVNHVSWFQYSLKPAWILKSRFSYFLLAKQQYLIKIKKTAESLSSHTAANQIQTWLQDTEDENDPDKRINSAYLIYKIKFSVSQQYAQHE